MPKGPYYGPASINKDPLVSSGNIVSMVNSVVRWYGGGRVWQSYKNDN